MKKTYRIIFIILAFALVCVLMSVMAFASEATTYPDAAFTITDKNDKSIDLQFDYMTNTFRNFPKDGDKIKVFYNGNASGSPDEVFTYSTSTGLFNGTFDTWLRWGIYEADYSHRTVGIRVNRRLDDAAYDSDFYYYIRKKVNVGTYRAPLKSLAYSPSRFKVYSEDVKVTSNNGDYFYSFCNRASHSAGGRSWKSAFAAGDVITAVFEDGKAIDYVNKDINAGNGYDDYFVNGDEVFIGIAENHRLNPGNNKVYVYLYMHNIENPSVKAAVDVYMLTPDMDSEDSQETNQKEKEKTVVEPINDITEKTAVKPTNNITEKTAIKQINVITVKNVSAGRTGRRLRVTWKGLAKSQRKTVSKIQIQYSNNKHFRNSKNVWVKNVQKKYISKNLKKGNYYVRVRNMKKVGNKKFYSKWSAVMKVKIR